MKCKRLSAAILSLVMIISLLPTTALAAEENDVWSKEYGEIRVYLDSNTEADYNELGGDHIRIMSEKYFATDGDGKGMRVCLRTLTKYWYTANAKGIKARDIDSVVLANNKFGKPSDKISIPIGGDTTYKVKVSQGHHQGEIAFGHEWGGYDYLRIDITKRTPRTVTYEFSGTADVNYPASVTPPASEQATATTKVTLPDVKTPITGTLNGQDGIWTFKGWTLPDGVTFTDDTHAKFTMPDTNVTVTGTWTFEATPPTETFVYVYFQTVDTAGNPITNNNVKDVTPNKNGGGWATLGKLTTEQPVSASKDKTEVGKLGAEVKDVDDDPNTKFERYKVNENVINGNVGISLIDWESIVLEHDGAADYVEFGTEAWHLNGKVTAYRAIYLDSDGKELTDASSKYYLKGADGIEVSTEQPTAPAGKEFDCWVTNDVTVKNNAFKMLDHDVTFTPKWKPGALKIEKILDEKSPAAGNTFSFTVTPEGSTTGTDIRITGAGNATIPILPVCNYTVEEDSSTAAVSGYRCTTQYSTDNSNWQIDPITVNVPSDRTVTVYVRNSYTPITADLIDNDIIIKHSVNGDPEHGNDDDTTAHIVNKDATISYQATLDMQNLKFGANPEHADDVSSIQAMIGTGPLWEFMEGRNITMFAGSKVNLYVKFDEKLNVTKGSFDNIKLTSDWFQLDKTHTDYLKQEAGGYWKIPCVIKGEKGTGNSSKITLSGVSLPLTPAAQGELSSDTALDITSGGYIDGTIKISTHELSLIGYTGYTYELSLIGKSKEAPAENTAKLKLDVPTYTVTYHGNGAGSGTTTDPTAYATGEKAKVKENSFTRDGYTFTGWNTQADGNGTPYKIGEQIKMTGNVTLYAQWRENSSRDDDDDKYFFAIEKVDAQDGHALNGAKFELYQLDSRGNKLAASRKTTSRWGTESGIALFSVSATKTNEGGDTWYYREITAPEGYVLDSTEHKITKNDFSTSQNAAIENVKTVRNYRGTTPDLLNGDDHFAYVVGYQDGCVHPNALITRAETATIFFRLLKDSVRDGNLLTSNTFADVPNAYWANTAISTMAGLGIVQGYNSTAFDPNASITRAEFAAICARFDTGKSSGTQTFSDIKGHWAEKYIERAAELGWIKGLEDGTFRPNDCITRAQAMTMINRVLNRIPEDASDLLPDMNVWPDCNPGDWFYLAVQEATNSHDYKHKAGNYETWTGMNKNPDWTRYEN